jgi:hypothetical protein
MPPTLTEASLEARVQDALTLTAVETAPTRTGGLPDALWLTEGLRDAPTQTGGLPDMLTQTEGLPDMLTLTGGLPATLLPDTPTRTGGLPDALSPDAPTRTGGLPDAPSSTGTGRTIRLTDDIRAFIVRGLARFDTPSQVAAAVHETFGIEISRQLVYKYDPTGCKPPAQRWTDLHAATRARFLADLAEIGVAQKVVRLRMLDRFAGEAEDNHRIREAAAFLEQAAKECGGFHERRRRRTTRLSAE